MEFLRKDERARINEEERKPKRIEIFMHFHINHFEIVIVFYLLLLPPLSYSPLSESTNPIPQSLLLPNFPNRTTAPIIPTTKPRLDRLRKLTLLLLPHPAPLLQPLFLRHPHTTLVPDPRNGVESIHESAPSTGRRRKISLETLTPQLQRLGPRLESGDVWHVFDSADFWRGSGSVSAADLWLEFDDAGFGRGVATHEPESSSPFPDPGSSSSFLGSGSFSWCIGCLFSDRVFHYYGASR